MLGLFEKKPKDFILGATYKMNIGTRSHNKKPYFVRLIGILENGIITEIPGNGHWLRIIKGENWDYHINRLQLIGSDEDARKLVYNQPNILN